MARGLGGRGRWRTRIQVVTQLRVSTPRSSEVAPAPEGRGRQTGAMRWVGAFVALLLVASVNHGSGASG